MPINHPTLVPRAQDRSAVFPARLFACGTKLIKNFVNPNNGNWIQAKDIAYPSGLRRSSLRLLEQDISHLRSALLSTFPTFFCSVGLRQSKLNRPNHEAPLDSPYPVKIGKHDGLTASSKGLYSHFNRTINSLSSMPNTYWHAVGFLPDSQNINWRGIYKAPTSKREGDVQYRLLHNVLPSLPVLHHLSSQIPADCGWFGERGTITHLFIHCPSIQPALFRLHELLRRIIPSVKLDFVLYWTLVPHARGRSREAVNLSNYLIISLKSTIYWLFRTMNFLDPLIFWSFRVRSKILLEHEFYKWKSSPRVFHRRWPQNDSLFVLNGMTFTWLI